LTLKETPPRAFVPSGNVMPTFLNPSAPATFRE
jgi:hypothetical protein